MSKKILVISTSLRANSNSKDLAEAFAEGAAYAGHEVELVFCMNEAGLSKLNTDWLRKIKRQLDEGSLLVQEAEAGKSGLLQAIFFGLDYQVSLIYQLMNEEQYFQVWLAKEE